LKTETARIANGGGEASKPGNGPPADPRGQRYPHDREDTTRPNEKDAKDNWGKNLVGRRGNKNGTGAQSTERVIVLAAKIKTKVAIEAVAKTRQKDQRGSGRTATTKAVGDPAKTTEQHLTCTAPGKKET